MAQFLDRYISSMLKRVGKRRVSDGTDLVEQLRRLAWEMQRRSLAIFHLEALQPDWLHGPVGRWIYALVTRGIGSALFGLAVVLPYGKTPLANLGFRADLAFGCWLGLSTSITGTCVAGVLAGIRLSASTGSSARSVLSTGSDGSTGSDELTGSASFMGAVSTTGPESSTGSMSSAPAKGRRMSRPLRLVLLAVAMATVNAILAGFDRHVAAAVMGAQTGAILAALLFPHPGIGDATRDIHLRAAIVFSRRRAWRSLPVAVVVCTIGGVALGVVESVRAGLVSAVLMALLWIAMSGIRGRGVEHVASANVAVRGSLRTAALRSSIVAGLVTPPIALTYNWSYGLCAMAGVVLTLWLWYGGYSAIQHCVLRVLLQLEGSKFCRTAVLDAAADRGLLHRVGGGYIFIHPLLKEHLANRCEEGKARGVQRGSADDIDSTRPA